MNMKSFAFSLIAVRIVPIVFFPGVNVYQCTSSAGSRLEISEAELNFMSTLRRKDRVPMMVCCTPSLVHGLCHIVDASRPAKHVIEMRS